jgi:hypothetical protein
MSRQRNLPIRTPVSTSTRQSWTLFSFQLKKVSRAYVDIARRQMIPDARIEGTQECRPETSINAPLIDQEASNVSPQESNFVDDALSNQQASAPKAPIKETQDCQPETSINTPLTGQEASNVSPQKSNFVDDALCNQQASAPNAPTKGTQECQPETSIIAPLTGQEASNMNFINYAVSNQQGHAPDAPIEGTRESQEVHIHQSANKESISRISVRNSLRKQTSDGLRSTNTAGFKETSFNADYVHQKTLSITTFRRSSRVCRSRDASTDSHVGPAPSANHSDSGVDLSMTDSSFLSCSEVEQGIYYLLRCYL